LWTIAEAARALGVSGDFPEHADRLRDPGQPAGETGMLVRGAERHAERGFISSFASARDGWEFADKAEASGAVAMIVPHRIEGVKIPQLVVKDTLIDGLWGLARAARARFDGPVIGLTGSAGKTAPRNFSAFTRTPMPACQLNNFWGVPLTLCNASPRASVWVV